MEVLLRSDAPVAEFRDLASGREGGFGALVDNCLFKQGTKVWLNLHSLSCSATLRVVNSVCWRAC